MKETTYAYMHKLWGATARWGGFLRRMRSQTGTSDAGSAVCRNCVATCSHHHNCNLPRLWRIGDAQRGFLRQLWRGFGIRRSRPTAAAGRCARSISPSHDPSANASKSADLRQLRRSTGARQLLLRHVRRIGRRSYAPTSHARSAANARSRPVVRSCVRAVPGAHTDIASLPSSHAHSVQAIPAGRPSPLSLQDNRGRYTGTSGCAGQQRRHPFPTRHDRGHRWAGGPDQQRLPRH
jgi:hypothetical protein